jgi:hypothetical protein
VSDNTSIAASVEAFKDQRAHADTSESTCFSSDFYLFSCYF